MGEETEKLAGSINRSVDGCVGCITWCVVGFIIMLAIGFAVQIGEDVVRWVS